MSIQTDWRHWLGAALIALVIIAGAWHFANRPPAKPTTVVAPGPNARLRDAPERL